MSGARHRVSVLRQGVRWQRFKLRIHIRLFEAAMMRRAFDDKPDDTTVLVKSPVRWQPVWFKQPDAAAGLVQITKHHTFGTETPKLAPENIFQPSHIYNHRTAQHAEPSALSPHSRAKTTDAPPGVISTQRQWAAGTPPPRRRSSSKQQQSRCRNLLR